MANEQSIRISARGDFGQLERGLKSLQSDLKDVVGEINRGARKGGFFDDSQLRALDIFKKRFTDTLDGLNKEFQKQNDIIDKMYKDMDKKSKDEQRNIQKQIDLRERELDVMRRQIMEAERLYGNRTSEASGYSPSGGGGGSNMRNALNQQTDNSALGSILKSSMLGKVGGIAKTGLALAGLGGLTGILMEAYQQAYTREVNSLDLAQRIRGQAGYSGSNTDMYDKIGNRMLGLGYTKPESWQFQDIYSQMGGALSVGSQYNLMKFARGYGLDANSVASTLGGVTQLGGGSPTQFANMIASSVSQSGMTPRILEVMQTSEGLLQTINTTLKDNGAKSILAYQTTLDKIGTANGMTKLTGQQGANIIQGLNGIYDPSQQNNWQWMGIRALQQYNPKKYGGMDLYNLQENFQMGLNNTDNMPAMVQYLKKASGGDNEVFKRMMQQWLQQGGYNATLQQVDQLDKVTKGFSVFSSSSIQKVMGSLQGGNSQSAYKTRANEAGQNVLNVNAQYEKALERTGTQFIDAITKMKKGVTNDINSLNDFGDALENMVDKYLPDWAKGISQFVSDLALAHPILTGLAFAYGGKVVKAGYNTVKKAVRRGRGGSGSGGGGTSEEEVHRPASIGPDGEPRVPVTGASGNLFERILGGAGSIADKAFWGIALGQIASEAGTRQQAGDTNWGSIWKSALHNLSFGIFDPKVINNKVQSAHNNGGYLASYMHDSTGMLSQAFSASGLNPKSKSSTAEMIKKQWASSVLSELEKTFHLNTNSKEGTVGLAEAFRKYTGLSESELPKALQTALSHYKIDYSKLKLNEDKIDKIFSGQRTDVSHIATKSLKDTQDTHKKVLDSTDKIQHGMLDASTGMLQDSSDIKTRASKSYDGMDSAMKSVTTNVSVAMGTLTAYMLQMASSAGGGTGTGLAQLSGSLLSKATAVVRSNEGSYKSVNRNDSGALSIGEFQWHGNRARDLLKSIKAKNPSLYNKYIGGALPSLNADWSHYTLTPGQASDVSRLLNTSTGHSAEDALAQRDVAGYIRKGQSLGIKDPNALMYFADMYNQNPAGAIRVARESNGTLQSLYSHSMSDPVLGRYGSRRSKTYQEISSGQIQTVNVKVSFDDSKVSSKKKGTTPLQDFEGAVSDIVQGTRDSLAKLFPSIFGY